MRLGGILLKRIQARKKSKPSKQKTKQRRTRTLTRKTDRNLPAPLQNSIQKSKSSELEGLTTQDLIRPSPELRRSVENFLLDQRSPHTQRAYGKDLKRFIQFLLVRRERVGPEPLNRSVWIAYKDWLISDNLNATTIDRHLATQRSFMRWLVEDGHIKENPAEKVRFLNPKKVSTTQAFTDEEVQKLLLQPNLHTRSGALHYAVLMVLLHGGLRRSELCGLEIQNLASERGQKFIKLLGKGNAERIIPLKPEVWNAIQHYLVITRRTSLSHGPLFSGVKNNRTGVRDQSLNPAHVFYIVRKYAQAAGIAKRVSPHSCRATAISNARDHQAPDRVIQEFAGWSSPNMIVRYDKRKTSITENATWLIQYGTDDPLALPRRLNSRTGDSLEDVQDERGVLSAGAQVGEID